MSIDPRRRLTPERIARAIRDGYHALGWARERYADDIAYYVGRHHAAGASNATPRPINLIAQAVHALLPSLVMESPRYIVRPKDFRLGGEAMKLQALSDQQAREDDDARTIYRPAVAEALFAPLALTYTRLRAGSAVAMVDGEQFDPGQVFTQRLSLDDYACDPTARAREAIQWQGHVFRADRDAILDQGLYPGMEDAITALPGAHERRLRDSEDGGAPETESRESITDQVELWSVELYQGGRILEAVLPAGTTPNPTLLRLQEYEGPEGGAYDALWYNLVPNSAIPLSPVSVFRDLAEAGDDVARKLIGQALRSKGVLAYTRTARDDALSVKEAEDGEAVAVDDASSLQYIAFQQILAGLLPFMQWLLAMWNNLSGNPNLLAGNGRIADTASESQILASGAATRVDDMRAQVLRLAKQIGRKRLWYWTTDPFIRAPVSVRHGALNVDLVYDAETRRGTHLDFAFDVEPRSMSGRNPELAAKRLVEMFGVLPQFMPFVQAGLVDFTALLRVLQREFEVDALDEIVTNPETIALRQQMLGAVPPPAPPQARRPGATGPTGDAMIGPALAPRV